eukprot:g4426.t1
MAGLIGEASTGAATMPDPFAGTRGESTERSSGLSSQINDATGARPPRKFQTWCHLCILFVSHMDLRRPQIWTAERGACDHSAIRRALDVSSRWHRRRA